MALGLGACVSEETVGPPQPPPQAALPPPPPLTPTPPPSRPAPATVAILLPQSGPNAALGQDMLNAAQLALSDIATDDLSLVAKDTGGVPDRAANAARSALADGAKLIIGPLTAAEVEAVSPIAHSAGIDVLAFSNQAKVAGNGTFVLGFLPEQEAGRIAGYASAAGMRRFAVLAPQTPYGQLTAHAFQEAVVRAGGEVDQVQYYEPAADPHPAIQALVPADRPDFQGLLMPEPSPQKLKSTAALLASSNVAPPAVRLLGTDAWDVPGLGSEPALVGGWYATTAPSARVAFEQRFRQAYGHRPQRLATLAYDAVGIAAVLQRTPGASFSTEALINPSGFAGADGIFRLLPDGTTERGLAVLQVEQSGTTVVSPAPESFQGVSQ